MAALPDGSIRIATKIDQTGAQTGLAGLTKSLKSFAAMIGITFGVAVIAAWTKSAKAAWSEQITAETKLTTVMRQRTNATNEQIQSILDLTKAQQKLGIIGDEGQLAGAQQLATFTTTTDQLKKLIPAMNNLVAQQYGYNASTESARNIANMMGRALDGQVGALTRVGISLSDEQEKIIKYGDKTQRAAVLAEIITNNVGEMNAALAKTDIGREKQLANVMGDVNEQFGKAFTQISVLFIPALAKLAGWLSVVADFANQIAQVLSTVFGNQETSAYDSVAAGASSAASATDDLTESTEAAGTAAEKASGKLASFDQLNVLAQDTSSRAESDMSASGLASSTGILPKNYNDEAIISNIKGTFIKISALVSGAMIALGAILCFSGVNIPLGIGLMAIGATGLAVAATANWDKLGLNISGELAAITGALGGAFLALGAVLAFSGANIPLGIGLMIIGASSLASAIAINWSSSGNKIANTVGMITGIIGGAFLALGGFLVFTGANIPLGIALMAMGAASLVSITALNWGTMSNSVRVKLTELTNLMGVSLLALGAMLAFSGVGIPLGIGLMLAGSMSLATSVSLNWDSVVTALQGPIGLVTGLVGGALLALGAILCFSGVGIPLGLALMAAGGLSLATAIAVNWNAIPDKIRGVWKAIKNILNDHIIAGVESFINRIVGGMEGMVNSVIGAFNWLIKKLNALHIDLPDIFGGETIGFHISTIKPVSLDPVNLPRLAQGAVIPPNRKFIATLGDQKSGTNIETPLATMIEAFRMALSEMNLDGSGDITITMPVYLDNEKIYEGQQKVQRRRGTKAVKVGSMA